MTLNTVPVVAESARWGSRAEALALRFGLPLAVADPDPLPELLLVVTANGLVLRQTGDRSAGPVRIDFVYGRQGYRSRHGGGRGQPLARAAGLRRGRSPSILDATAGLGRDAFVLASLGCELTLLERSPVVAALLQDAMDRASHHLQSRPAATRMRLHCADALDYLAHLDPGRLPAVIYLDPMFPHRRKSALVKKEMRLFRRLVGEDEDAPQLLALARNRACHRVVVKRPAGAEWIGGEEPSMEISSPNTRYDIYVRRPFPAS